MKRSQFFSFHLHFFSLSLSFTVILSPYNRTNSTLAQTTTSFKHQVRTATTTQMAKMREEKKRIEFTLNNYLRYIPCYACRISIWSRGTQIYIITCTDTFIFIHAHKFISTVSDYKIMMEILRKCVCKQHEFKWFGRDSVYYIAKPFTFFFLNEKEKNRKSSLQLGLKLKFCAFTACHNKWHAKEVKLKLLKKCHLISVFLLISQNEIQQFNVVNPRAFMKFLILFLYLFKFEIYF